MQRVKMPKIVFKKMSEVMSDSLIFAQNSLFGNYNFLVAGTVKCSAAKLVKEIFPYVLVCVLVLLICTYVPVVVTILPELIYGAV